MSKLQDAIEDGGDDPRMRKVRTEFRAVYGFLPTLDGPHDGWYTWEVGEWSVDLEGTLLCRVDGRVTVIESLTDTPEELLQ